MTVVGELLSSSLLLRVIECVDGRREGVMLVWILEADEEWFLEEEGSTSNPIIYNTLITSMYSSDACVACSQQGRTKGGSKQQVASLYGFTK